MKRSGKVFSVLLAATALTGCAVSEPAETPASTPTSETVEASCPSGLEEALEKFLVTVPVGDALPEAVDVVEFSDLGFASDLVASMVDCSFTTHVTLPDGLMAQVYGISPMSEGEIGSALEVNGWQQLTSGDGAEYAWESPDHGDYVQLFIGGVVPQPALGFPSWPDFLGSDEVLILGGIGV